MIGRTNTGGGGGGGSATFTVVGGTTRPENATQNTVWVNTSTEITEYVMSATEPENPTEGMLWLMIGNESSVEIDFPIGKNWIVLYLHKTTQYVGGSWISVDTKCYQNGVWKSVDTYLISSGNTGYTIIAEGKPPQSGFLAMTSPEVVKNSGNITIKGKDGYGVAYIKESIDLTTYNTLTINGKFNIAQVDIPCFYLSVWSSIGVYISSNRVAFTELNASGQTVLDISNLNGQYIVGISMASAVDQVIYDLVLS